MGAACTSRMKIGTSSEDRWRHPTNDGHPARRLAWDGGAGSSRSKTGSGLEDDADHVATFWPAYVDDSRSELSSVLSGSQAE